MVLNWIRRCPFENYKLHKMQYSFLQGNSCQGKALYSCVRLHPGTWLQYLRSSIFFADSGVTPFLLCPLGKNLVSSPPQSILWSQFSIQVFSLSSNSFRPSTRSSGADSYPQCRRESETLIFVELFLIYASASKFRYPVTWVNHPCALPAWQLVKLEVYSSCMLLNIDFFFLC